MTRIISPIDPRLEVRHVGDRELEAMLTSLLPDGAWNMPVFVARAIEEHFGAYVDQERLGRLIAPRIDLENFVFPEPVAAPTGHDHIRIRLARSLDEAAGLTPEQPRRHSPA